MFHTGLCCLVVLQFPTLHWSCCSLGAGVLPAGPAWAVLPLPARLLCWDRGCAGAGLLLCSVRPGLPLALGQPSHYCNCTEDTPPVLGLAAAEPSQHSCPQFGRLGCRPLPLPCAPSSSQVHLESTADGWLCLIAERVQCA